MMHRHRAVHWPLAFSRRTHAMRVSWPRQAPRERSHEGTPLQLMVQTR